MHIHLELASQIMHVSCDVFDLTILKYNDTFRLSYTYDIL